MPNKPGYLIGVFDDNHMGVKAKMKRENKMNAPLQQVGGFFAHHIDDLRRVALPWFEYTHAVRTDPDSWARTGDVFNCPRLAFEKCQGKECRCPGPPWISEMYGYVFGASEAGLNPSGDASMDGKVTLGGFGSNDCAARTVGSQAVGLEPSTRRHCIRVS